MEHFFETFTKGDCDDAPATNDGLSQFKEEYFRQTEGATDDVSTLVVPEELEPQRGVIANRRRFAVGVDMVSWHDVGAFVPCSGSKSKLRFKATPHAI